MPWTDAQYGDTHAIWQEYLSMVVQLVNIHFQPWEYAIDTTVTTDLHIPSDTI